MSIRQVGACCVLLLVLVSTTEASGRFRRAEVVKDDEAAAKKVVAEKHEGDPEEVFPAPPEMELDPVADAKVEPVLTQSEEDGERRRREAGSEVVKDDEAAPKKIVAEKHEGDPEEVFPEPPEMKLDPVADEDVADEAVQGD